MYSFWLLFSHSVVSDSLQPHGMQHARLPCPSLSPGACSNSCPLSLWCHPTISSSVIPFSSCLQSFPASGSFLMSQLFASGGQIIGASVSVLPMIILYMSSQLNIVDLPLHGILESAHSSLQELECVHLFSILCSILSHY